MERARNWAISPRLTATHTLWPWQLSWLRAYQLIPCLSMGNASPCATFWKTPSTISVTRFLPTAKTAGHTTAHQTSREAMTSPSLAGTTWPSNPRNYGISPSPMHSTTHLCNSSRTISTGSREDISTRPPRRHQASPSPLELCMASPSRARLTALTHLRPSITKRQSHQVF